MYRNDRRFFFQTDLRISLQFISAIFVPFLSSKQLLVDVIKLSKLKKNFGERNGNRFTSFVSFGGIIRLLGMRYLIDGKVWKKSRTFFGFYFKQKITSLLLNKWDRKKHINEFIAWYRYIKRFSLYYTTGNNSFKNVIVYLGNKLP